MKERWSYPSAEVQSVYSTAPVDWAKIVMRKIYTVIKPFCRIVQITRHAKPGSREIPFVSHLSTDDQNFPRHNQRRAALIWIDAGYYLSDLISKRVDSLAVVEGVLSHFFLFSTASRESGTSARPALKAQSVRGNPFRASHLVTENSVLLR